MKVYRVRHDVNNYQSLFTNDKQFYDIRFDCTNKAATWNPPQMFVLEPLLKEGDFISLPGGAHLVVRQTGLSKVRRFFMEAGELLPISFQGQELTLLNITRCFNYLDHDHSLFLKTAQGVNVYPKKYVFYADRWAECSLFKIPETRAGEVLTLEVASDPECEFKAAYEHYKMTGLKFELLWEG